MRIGLFGGTFDPIHLGHLQLAMQAQAAAQLDRIYFVTSAHPPHKDWKIHASFLDRHAMVTLALAGRNDMIPSSLEAERIGKSYSIDTLRQFKKMVPAKAALFFLIGMDAFLDIKGWKDYALLPELCNFIVFTRPGFALDQLQQQLPQPFLEKLKFAATPLQFKRHRENKIFIFEGFSCAISSTEVRQEIRAGHKVPGCLPAVVEEYIHKTGIYTR